jgi:hypothetical protein
VGCTGEKYSSDAAAQRHNAILRENARAEQPAPDLLRVVHTEKVTAEYRLLRTTAADVSSSLHWAVWRRAPGAALGMR